MKEMLEGSVTDIKKKSFFFAFILLFVFFRDKICVFTRIHFFFHSWERAFMVRSWRMCLGSRWVRKRTISETSIVLKRSFWVNLSCLFGLTLPKPGKNFSDAIQKEILLTWCVHRMKIKWFYSFGWEYMPQNYYFLKTNL